MKKMIYNGRYLSMGLEELTLPNGIKKTYERIYHPGASSVICLSEDGDKVLLVYQYRPVIGQWLWEIPAGLLEKNEDPLECARRELLEETGWTGHGFFKLITLYNSAGGSDEVTHIYRATLLEKKESALEEGEVLEVHLLTRQEVRSLIRNQKIQDPKTLVGLGLMGFV